MDIDTQGTTEVDVTVLIPTRNRHDLLRDSLESVARQDWQTWECIVIDDGSEPPVMLPNDDMGFQLLRRDVSGGPSAARNSGLRVAKGRFIAFLDDDDLMAPSRIRIGMEALAQNPDANCHVGTLLRSGSPDVEKIPSVGPSLSERQLRTGTPSVEQLLIRKDLVEEFDEELRVGEDVEWWLRVESSVIPVITEDVVAIVRMHDEARPGVSPEIRYQARLRTYEKNRHRLPTYGHTRSRHQRRLAEAALETGRPLSATRFALAALISRPEMRKLKLLFRSSGAYIRSLFDD